VHAVSGDLIGPAASLEVYSDLLHGERITLPGAPEVAIVRPFDDADYAAPTHPQLAAVRSLEEEADHDLLAEALADDEDYDAEYGEAYAETAGGADDAAVEEPPAEEPAPEAPVRPSRLLLGDVVDLAEQVARELGVALPPPAPAPVAADEAPALVDETIEPGRTQPRLPGLADLHAALGSPEVNRALPDRSDPAAEASADAGTDTDAATDAATDAPTDGDADAVAIDAGREDEGRDDDGMHDGPALNLRSSDPRDAGAPPSRQGPHIVVIEDAAEPPAPGEGDGPTLSAPEAAADLREEPVVDLRVRGTDGPHIVLRPAVRDSAASADAVGPTLHLRGLGGSDGGSIL